MKNLSYLLFLLFVLIVCQFISGCQLHKKHTPNEYSSQPVSDYEGVYEGTLPCADCPGIKTRLILNKEKTFVYEIQYLEKDDARFLYKGTYAVEKAILTIHEDGLPIHFLITDNELHLLDTNLKPATGELASSYTLKKQK